MFEALFRPLVLRGISIRNRIVMAPMNTNFAEADGSVSKQFTKFYVEIGNGGTGHVSCFLHDPGRSRPTEKRIKKGPDHAGSGEFSHDDRPGHVGARTVECCRCS